MKLIAPLPCRNHSPLIVGQHIDLHFSFANYRTAYRQKLSLPWWRLVMLTIDTMASKCYKLLDSSVYQLRINNQALWGGSRKLAALGQILSTFDMETYFVLLRTG